MKKAVFAILIFLAAISPLFCMENFIVNDYHVDVTVSDDSKSTFHEYLYLDFITPSHGIYRDIQYRFNPSPFVNLEADITNIMTNVETSLSYNGDFISLRMGNPDKYVFGDVMYQIAYDYMLEDDGNREYDEWYMNLLSAAWDTEVDSFSFSVTFPHPVDENRIWLTSGEYGSTKSVPFNVSDDGLTVYGTVENLGPYSAVTLRAEFDEGYFASKPLKKDYGSLFNFIYILLSLACIAFIAYSFITLGRDREIIAPVEFYPPEGLSSLDVGYIIDNTVTFDKDILSMVFYFADKGYLKINEIGKNDYEFVKLSDIPDERPGYEKRLFEMIFSESDKATMESLARKNFAEESRVRIGNDIERYYAKNHPLFEPRSAQRASLIRAAGLLGVIVFSFFSSMNNIGELTLAMLFPSLAVFGILILLGHRYFANCNISGKALKIFQTGLAALFLLLLTAFSAFILAEATGNAAISVLTALANSALVFSSSFFSYAVNKRSDYADEMLAKIMGYREFLEKVEIDRLRTLIEEDPEYYYHNLSYAIALNLEEEYSSKFSALSLVTPQWYYSPNPLDSYLLWHAFSRGWRRSYDGYISTVNPPGGYRGGSRSHGGFSGFSGGGFSGGGGRSW